MLFHNSSQNEVKLDIFTALKKNIEQNKFVYVPHYLDLEHLTNQRHLSEVSVRTIVGSDVWEKQKPEIGEK